MDKNNAGHRGEERAADFLRRRGYTVEAMNFACRGGEIDIIARRRGFLVFVEVKLRKNADFAEAREYVTAAKQQKILIAAQTWMALHPTELQPRFDVIEIYAPNGVEGKLSFRHIEDAFQFD